MENNAKALSPLKAIKEFCKRCVGSYAGLKDCGGDTDCNGDGSCPLFEYRYGKNPNRKKKVFTEDEKEAMVERMKIARESKEE